MLAEPVALASGSEEVVARRLTTADAETFAAHVARDLAHLGAYLAWPAVTVDAPDAAEWLGRYARGEDGRVVAVGAWRRGDLVGGGTLFGHDPLQATVELGVWMTTGVEGRGLGTAICRLLLTAARRDLGVERVAWQAVTGNLRSRRLAEKLGFVYEGTLRSSMVLRGGRMDMDLLSLVGTEIDRAAGV